MDLGSYGVVGSSLVLVLGEQKKNGKKLLKRKEREYMKKRKLRWEELNSMRKL